MAVAFAGNSTAIQEMFKRRIGSLKPWGIRHLRENVSGAATAFPDSRLSGQGG